MRALAVVVVLLVSLGREASAESADVAGRLERIWADIESDRAFLVRRAIRALKKLGPSAVAPALDRVDLVEDEALLTRYVDALAALGTEEAIAQIRGSSVGTRSERRNGVLSALRVHPDRPGGARVSARLRAVEHERFERIPPTLLRRIGPAATRVGGRTVEAGPDGVVVRTDAGEIESTGGPGAVVRIASGPTRSMAVFGLVGAWFAAPASGWAGRIAGQPVEILDADLDGDVTERDWIRWADGAFAPVRAGALVWIDDVLRRYEVGVVDGAVTVVIEREPLSARLAPSIHRFVRELGVWRRTIGLDAIDVDLDRSHGCQAHVRYWDLNGFSDHREDPRLPGYTEHGAKAGKHGTTSPLPIEGAAALHETMLHRITVLGSASHGLGVAAGAEGYCLWLELPSAAERRAPILLPAPGQTDVPTHAREERPPPTRDPGFYELPRGYPITIELRRLPRLESSAVDLYEMRGAEPDAVGGERFDPRDPVTPDRTGNRVHFVPRKPLEPLTRYVVRFRARLAEGEPMLLVWSFRTR